MICGILYSSSGCCWRHILWHLIFSWSFDFGKDFEGVGAVGDTFCGTSFFGFLEYLTLIKILKVWVLLATHFVALGEGGGGGGGGKCC